jgi:hypothetical protein
MRSVDGDPLEPARIAVEALTSTWIFFDDLHFLQWSSRLIWPYSSGKIFPRVAWQSGQRIFL